MQSVTPTFSGAVNATSRELATSVLVSWDKNTASGIDYFTIGTSVIGGSDIIKTTAGGTIAAANLYDYDVIPASGVVSWSTSISLTQFPFGLVQRQADVTLSNASGDFLPSSGTSLGPDIDIGRPLIIQAGFGAETIPMFTGYTDTPVNDISSRTVSLHCYDGLDYLNSFTSVGTAPLQKMAADAIIETLLKEAGFATDQYVLESSLNPIIQYLDPFNSIIGNIISDLCNAEGAIFFADESGILHFWNRQHFSVSTTPVATLTYSNITDLQIQNGPILNSVEATGTPLQVVSGLQQVYSLTDSYYLQANGSPTNNFIVNPSFEISTSGWSGNLVRTNAKAYAGNYSASGTSFSYDLSSSSVNSTDGIGSTASFQAEILPASGTSVTVELLGDPVNNESITGTSSVTVSGGDWQNVTLNASHFALTATPGISEWSQPFNTNNLLFGNASLVTYSGYLYVLGYTPGIFYLPLDNMSNISLTSSLADQYNAKSVVAVNGYMYIIGGFMVNGGSDTYVDNCWYAPINSNGSLGNWQATTALPVAYSDSGYASYNGYIYIIGGEDSQYVYRDVYYAKPNSDGTISSWTAGSNFPLYLDDPCVFAYKGYLYVVGGYGGSESSSNLDTVYYAPINSNGSLGSWSTTTSLPKELYGLSSVIYGGTLYTFGGITYDSSTGTYQAYDTVYYTAINTDGTLGTWGTTESLPTARGFTGAVSYGNSVYIFDGATTSGSSYVQSDLVEKGDFIVSGITVSGSSSKPFYLDAASTDISDPYFDGDSASTQLYNYDWTATQGLSGSVRVPKVHTLDIQVPLSYSSYNLDFPTASGLNYSNIAADQSFYSFSSTSGIGGIFGQDLTENISLASYSVSGTTAFLSFTNNSSQQAYLTNLVLYGITAQPSTTIDQFYSNSDSISKYRLNPSNTGQIYTISSDYIPTAGAAKSLCEWVVDSFSDAYLQFSPTNFAIPNLQFGDCVALVNRDTGETRQGFVFGISNSMNKNGSFTQQLTIQERALTPYFTIGSSLIGGTSTIAP